MARNEQGINFTKEEGAYLVELRLNSQPLNLEADRSKRSQPDRGANKGKRNKKRPGRASR